MVSTRSKTAQSRIEDFAQKNGATAKGAEKRERKSTKAKAPQALSDATEPSSKRKRGGLSSTPKDEPTKRLKTEKDSMSPSRDDDSSDPDIIINRAPVLQLWGASVAHFVYPDLSWENCVSVGSAISTICAVAKGRSIGTISEKDESESKQRQKEEAKKKQKDLDVVHVMQFKLKLKDGLALVGSEQKGKPGTDAPLKKKFGDKEYEAAKKAFEQVLNSWRGEEEELNKQAFHFYEAFRPDVSRGQKGWGRKGELSLAKVRNIVQRDAKG